ncbi:MAG TPA: hypothetical protein VFP10_06720 [Candidatus Eisenbacteria bacterium]|nr:hypothetical protein [Candidatus Eisenbacteria bacterium]
MNYRYQAPVRYRTEFEIWGLPLVDVRMGEVVDGQYRRGIARGWIAVGDIAFGVLGALGGVAVGGVAVGGLSLGAVALGGLALGGLALGGGAIGVWALGGAAIALELAVGGFAMSRDVAVGGLALAPHANPPGMVQSLNDRYLMRYPGMQRASQAVLFIVPLVVLFVLWRSKQKNDETIGGPGPSKPSSRN